MDDRIGLLVVGGGPAGLAGAAQAASLGLRTVLVDERPTLGGQVYKQPSPGFVVRDAKALGRDYLAGVRLVAQARSAGVELRSSTAVVSLRGTTAVLLGDGDASTVTVAAERVLLAPGAYDRPVPFPGWTLPGVVTAGGAQALLKVARVVPGDRLLFAGSGPLALAFPAQLAHYGVNVVLALEAGPPPGPRAVLGLLAAAPGNAALLRDGLGYRAQLARRGVSLRYRRMVVRAEGDGRVEEAVHAEVDDEWRVVAGSEERLAVDTICLGYGFVPSVELMRLAGCAVGFDDDRGGPVVVVDEWMRTTVPLIFAAGDGTGVAGSIVALDEGRLAAIAAAADLGAITEPRARALARPVRARLAAKARLARALRRLYAVGPGVYELATPSTVICRCEEVAREQIDAAIVATADLNVVKGYTRAGMGLCQGRNCQPEIAVLIARRHGLAPGAVAGCTPRPPLRPVPLGALADDTVPDSGLFVVE